MERYSVKKPFTVLVAVIMVIVLGVISLMNMTADLLPSISLPYMIVITTYPGASPEKVEAEVTQPMESGLGTVSGVVNVYSTSSENYSMVQLEFEDGTDMDSAMVKVSSAVQQVSAGLPDLCGTPSIMELSMDMMATMYVGVGRDGYDIYQNSIFVRDEVVPYIERQAGVASVSTVGLVEKSVQVDLNKAKIDELNDEILVMTNDALAEAKAELDKAEKQVKDGLAELKKQQSNFGSMLAGGIFGSMDGQVSDLAAQLQTTLKTLMEQVDELRQTVNDPALQQALNEVSADIAELQEILARMEDNSATAEDITRASALLSRIAGNMSTILGALNQSQPTPAPTAEPTAAPTAEPTAEPEGEPTAAPSAEPAPTAEPTAVPTAAPTPAPTAAPADSLDEIYNTLAQLEALAGQLPALMNGLEQMVGGLTQAQLEAAVAFSTAQSQLTMAQAQLESARTQYETARDQALENANLDALLNVNALSGIIYAQNFAMPAGYIDDKEDNSWLLKIGTEYDTPDQIADTLLVSMDGLGDVRLADVADVTVIDNADESYARLNGTPAVVLCVFKGSTAGTNDVSNQCKEALAELSEKYEGFSSIILMDQGDYITMIVDSVVSSMISGAILAIIVLALFLKDVKPTLVVAISIPLSVLFAIVMMYFTGLSLNMMTLSGLALGIGMLVDNSIVVIENIYRLRTRGVAPARAAVQGTKQVAGSIIASTLTTVCVFLPMVFTSGTVRELLLPLGLSITYCLMASLIVAMTVVPAAGSTVLRKSKMKPHPWFDKVQDLYGKSLDWCLRHKAVPLFVSIALLAFCVYQVFVMGIVMLPAMSSDEIQVTISTPEEMDRETSYKTADAAIEAILTVEGVANVGVMDSGSTAGLLGGMGGGGSYGNYICYVTADTENLGAAEVDRICADIEAATESLDCTVSAASGGMSDMTAMMGSGLSLSVYGTDMDTITGITEEIIEIVESVEGFSGATNGLAENGDQTIQLNINKDKAMGWGLTVAQIYQEVAARMTTTASSATITLEGVTVDVTVRDVTDPVTVENLMDIPFTCTIMGDGGTQTTEKHTLGEFATIEYTTSVGSISRENQLRYMTVTATTEEGYNTTLLSRTLQDKLDEYIAAGSLPDGYSIHLGGETEQVNEMLEQMLLLMFVALIFVYLVMVAQFQSLLSPFIVMFTIPLAFTGGLIGLMLYGQQLSLLSLMGFLVLMGTVVNNGIVFVDYANQLRIGGMERRPALIAAGCTRMRPIFMTAMTTILAMGQLIFGDDMGSQLGGGMAVVIAAGLTYATLMTLYIVPIMYDILFKKPPLNVDVGDDNVDDVIDDAAEYLEALRRQDQEVHGERSAREDSALGTVTLLPEEEAPDGQ